MRKPRIPASDVAIIFDCDADQGVLYWREPGPGRRVGQPVHSWAGRHGYLYTTLSRKPYKRRHYLVAHLIWAWVHGVWPTELIDHINRNKGDNRIKNLQETTHNRNMVNKSVLRSSRSQMKGVKLDMRNGRYYAYLATRKKTIYLGGYTTAEEAYAARLEAELKFYGATLSEPQSS